MIRCISAAALIGLLLTTAPVAAETNASANGALAPGKPAGVKAAQITHRGWWWIGGATAVIGLAAILTSEGGNSTTSSTTSSN